MIKDLIAVSKYSGMRLDLVQSGGGNSSVKLDAERMLIKSSGIQMADIQDTYGYSSVNYPKLAEYMEQLISHREVYKEKSIMEQALIEGGKPSIETFLHAITGRVTLHTHPVTVGILTTRKGGMEELANLFPDALLVGYATPGIKLATEYYKAFMEAKRKVKPLQVIFLKNHGLVVCGDTAAEVIEITEHILYTIEKYLHMDFSAYRNAYAVYSCLQRFAIFQDKVIVKAENKVLSDTFASCGYQMWDYQFCPDCLVYCGKRALAYHHDITESELKKFADSYGEPAVITYGSDIYLRAESVRKAREIEAVLTFSAQVYYQNRDYIIETLSDEEQNFLLEWEDEKYRQRLQP